jgi:hypothetical protein
MRAPDPMGCLLVLTLGDGGRGASGEGGGARARVRYGHARKCSPREEGMRASLGVVYQGRRDRVAERCSASGSVSTRGRAWQRRTTRRRQNGTGARPMRATGERRRTSARFTPTAAVGPGRFYLPRHLPHVGPSFHVLSGNLRRGEALSVVPKARRHAEQAEGAAVVAQGRREWPRQRMLSTRPSHVRR